jgi:hypothetical protein
VGCSNSDGQDRRWQGSLLQLLTFRNIDSLTSENAVLPRPGNTAVQGTSIEAIQYPGDINQALIELGSTVCKIREPDCGSCPLRTWCRAYAVSNSDVQKVNTTHLFTYPVLNWISYSQQKFLTSRMHVSFVRRCRVTMG